MEGDSIDTIPAQSLATLPDIAAMTIQIRADLFAAKNIQETQMATPSGSVSKERSLVEEEVITQSKSIGSPKKKKSRPSTAIKRPTLRAVESSPKVRPNSAPARMTKQLPVRVYGSQYMAEVRALPDMPTARIMPKMGGKRGHHNAILKDIVRLNESQIVGDLCV